MVEYKKDIQQFIRFFSTGVLNTLIDFAVLNILIGLFGLAGENSSSRFLLFKTISSAAAILNSYLMNKRWVFKGQGTRSEALLFMTVTLTSLALNSTISSIVFHAEKIIFPLSSLQLLANSGALVGTLLALMLNFFGYKLIVFKKQQPALDGK